MKKVRIKITLLEPNKWYATTNLLYGFFNGLGKNPSEAITELCKSFKNFYDMFQDFKGLKLTDQEKFELITEKFDKMGWWLSDPEQQTVAPSCFSCGKFLPEQKRGKTLYCQFCERVLQESQLDSLYPN